jgi:uncharacterized membrane protein YeaQ/YmgE (transglycosylase-associated protein family)
MTFLTIITWLIIGLVIGAVAHLLVPGRQRIGIILTVLIGIVGALVGGVVTYALLGAGHAIITFIVSLIVAALLIAAISHPRSHAYLNGGRRRRRLHI